ncbi:T6SS phospholipase effector Tle1-like catalytic domain-containing protein [Apibacter adventoris]|uniref:T6SS Phospholipase effector Tle1-like catalytic domain-containing protein n=1 Tax=Apibacter adventoris TaxID=1679466 RepID=A0A2S8ACJ2_9FLAO|nr:DUF2235 domain-containing protein [Apibacter adventoris]PQL92352.1 hypothetical protein C4S77_06685 [Apibacter adventoris]
MSDIQFGEYAPGEGNKQIQDLTLGVFFDGTLNNRRNTYIRKEKEKKKKGLSYDQIAVKEDPWAFSDSISKGSYENDYSNVARMADYYKLGKKKAVYIEGPGTKDGKTDTVTDYLTGTGSTGVRMKVRSACEKIADKVFENKELILTLDVFGFSRGAAGARNFIHEITKAAYKTGIKYSKAGVSYKDSFGEKVNDQNLLRFGHLGYLLQQKNVTIKSISIRFVGLYDTVSSYGVNFNDDVKDLNLNSLSNWRVSHAVQLAASDEWREKFNRTNIGSAGEKGREYLIPGAHADVGGCYESGWFEQAHEVVGGRTRVEAEKKSLISRGWYKEKELKLAEVYHNEVISYEWLGKRYIDNRYSYITLHLMCQLASEKKAEFDLIEMRKINNFPVPLKTSEGKPHILGYVKGKLEAYIEAVKKVSPQQGAKIRYQDYLDFTNEKILRNGYVHWSATGKTGHGVRSGNIRKIIAG